MVEDLSPKARALALVQEMPDDAQLSEICESIESLWMVDDIKQNRGKELLYTADEARAQLEQWSEEWHSKFSTNSEPSPISAT